MAPAIQLLNNNQNDFDASKVGMSRVGGSERGYIAGTEGGMREGGSWEEGGQVTVPSLSQ